MTGTGMDDRNGYEIMEGDKVDYNKVIYEIFRLNSRFYYGDAATKTGHLLTKEVAEQCTYKGRIE